MPVQISDVDETRQGMFIYDGAPSRYNEWEFRTMLKWEAVKDDDRKRREITSSIVDSLRGDASQAAMDLGRERLMAEDGVPQLASALLAAAFPKQKSEAKDLYKAGHNEAGVLSRQRGESMVNFVSRRRRWWMKLKTMDSTIELSTHTLGELMLDAARLGKVERLMVLTSTGNSTEFERIATAMMDQHERIHVDEKRQDRDSGVYQPKRRSYMPHRKPVRRQAFAAIDDIDADIEPSEQADPLQGLFGESDDNDQHGYVAEADEDDDQSEDDAEPESKEDAELQAFTACIDTGMTEAQVAMVVQTEVVAFMAFNSVAAPSDKGKGGKNKGRGKGKDRKPVRRFGFRGGKVRPRLTLEQRKQALAKLKEKTKCNVCGETGHWAGDKACKKKTAMLAIEAPVSVLRRLLPQQQYRTVFDGREDKRRRTTSSGRSDNLTVCSGRRS